MSVEQEDSTQVNIVPALAGVFSLVILAFTVWQGAQLLLGHKFQFVDNDLEKAVQLHTSTRADFTAFTAKGGLENEKNATWKGYAVKHVGVEYDTGNKVSSVNLILLKKGYQVKLASAENLMSSLSGQCAKNWQMQQDQYVAQGAKTVCRILETRDGFVDVIYGVNAPETPQGSQPAPQAQPIQPAVPDSQVASPDAKVGFLTAGANVYQGAGCDYSLLGDAIANKFVAQMSPDYKGIVVNVAGENVVFTALTKPEDSLFIGQYKQFQATISTEKVLKQLEGGSESVGKFTVRDGTKVLIAMPVLIRCGS